MSDFDDIRKLLHDFIGQLTSQTELNKLGLAGIRKIRDRTRKGIDVDGRPFKPYSKRYKQKRAEAGLPTHIVNLEFNDVDGMLTKIDHVVNNTLDAVTIDIMDPEKKKIGYYHDEAGVAKVGENIRHWWGLNEEEQKDIVEIVARDAEDILADLASEYNY